MNLVFFDTNAYINLVNIYNNKAKNKGICIKDFAQSILNKEKEAGYLHVLHHLVIMEIIQKYHKDENRYRNTLKILSALYCENANPAILPPFEIELCRFFNPHAIKQEYVKTRQEEHNIICRILNAIHSAEDINSSQETKNDIEVIADTVKSIKESSIKFSYSNKQNAEIMSREDLAEEFGIDFINCIRLAIHDEVVDHLNLDSFPFTPLSIVLSFASKQVFSWSRSGHSTQTSQVLKNIPNTFIDALILSSACLGCERECRTLVSGDDAIKEVKDQVNKETTKILNLNEYLKEIHI